MFRIILSALAGAVFLVWNAAAEPTMAQVQASARWSAKLQAPLQKVLQGFEYIDEYSRIMDQAVSGDLPEAEAHRQITTVTEDLNRRVDDYVAALEALPPHPMPDHPLGAAMQDIRVQLIGQASLLEDFFGRLDSLSRKAIEGDVDAVDQLGGEIFRSGAFLVGTDIALLRTQVAALETDNPLRNLNLAAIGHTQFTREVMLAEATYRFGPSPGFSDGDLDLAATVLADARREIAHGKRNAASMRALLIAEKATPDAPQELYDTLLAMLDTFNEDWAEMSAAITECEALLEMMIEGDEGADAAFDAFLVSSGVLSQNLVDRQLARSQMLAN